MPVKSQVITAFFASSRSMDINSLHRTLGHLNYDDCRRLVAKKLVADVDTLTGRVDLCVSCVKAKHARSPFPVSTRRSKQKLELIHSDLMGPFPESLKGCKYAMTLIDDYT
ncbi:hypothetical protein CPB86DRAFT_716051, partial [Serendipita vermifera]